MKCYRIKHVETGLYYRPCVGVGKTKTNLGLKGKVYTSYPKASPVFDDNYFVNISEVQINKFPQLLESLIPKSRNESTNYIKAHTQTWEIEEL